MKRLTLVLKDKADWQSVYNADDNTLRIHINSSLPKIGEILRVDLSLGVEETKVIFRGTVMSHCNEPKGVRISLGKKERAKVDFLRGYARDGMLNLRRARRLPINLKVTYGGIEGPVHSYTRDINEEGLFVVSREPLPEGSELHLLVNFPNEVKPHNLVGRVSHTVVVEDEDIPGMGIVFKINPQVAEKLIKSVDALEKAFIGGRLESKYLE